MQRFLHFIRLNSVITTSIEILRRKLIGKDQDVI